MEYFIFILNCGIYNLIDTMRYQCLKVNINFRYNIRYIYCIKYFFFIITGYIFFFIIII